MEHLYDKLVKYSVSDYYGFHMPGHKRQQITGAEKLPYEIDITEIEGFDDLHHAEDLFIKLQEYAAEVFHAEETHYLVNGSTVGLLSAVLGCTGYGDRILMARNCHKSVYNAVDLNGLVPEYVYPEFDETTDLNGEIRAEKIEQILEKDRGMNRKAGIKAVVITSPTYDGVVSDIERISEVVHKYGIPLIVDNTFGTPYLIRPIEHGADIVVHSATKFIGGHGSSLGGVIVDSGKFDWVASGKFPQLTEPDASYHGVRFVDAAGAAAYIVRIRAVLLRDTGAAISPFNAFILLQGLETLSLRVERHVANALKVIDFLVNHPKVAAVNHPSLPGHPDHAIYQRYFPGGAGSIFTFEVKGGTEEAQKFIDSLQIFSLLANVADVKSLVIHPATTTHSQLNAQELEEQGIKPGTVRLSIGTEHIEDIIDDLRQALEKI